MNRYTLALLIAASVLAAGCRLDPRYDRPAAPVPQQWPAGPAYPTTGPATRPADVAMTNWPQFYTDPKLQRVIAISLENNRNLRLAALNVQRARALLGLQQSELLPVFGATGDFNRQRVPKDLSLTGQPYTSNQFDVGAGISSWEIDFFGRIQSLVEAALQQYLATEQARRSAQISLVSEVADAYLTLAARRDRLQIARTTLQTQLDAYDLVSRRFKRGYVSELDVHRAQTQVDIARTDVAAYIQTTAQAQNALDFLAGTTVPENLLPESLTSVMPPRPIAAGLSSDVLLNRPDILEAEDNLKAANANIGAARANFFPRITLSTAVGTGSNELSGLFKAGSLAWNFNPQVVVPVFAPATWANLQVTEVEKKQAVAQYERVIQNAFREVADALAVRGTVNDEIAAQESLVQASAETFRLSSLRYEKGLDNYLSVLDAQQALYTAQQQLVSLRLQGVTSQVQLYAVLGGGWQSVVLDSMAHPASRPAASQPTTASSQSTARPATSQAAASRPGIAGK